MITVHTGVLPDEKVVDGGWAIREPNDYPRTRQRIQQALSQEENLQIFVLTRVCDGWFWDLFEYHSDVIHINDSPADRLKRKLSVNALPAKLMAEPDLIIELDLLDLPDPAESVNDVWTWIIQHKLGKVWAEKDPSQEHLSELVEWYVENAIDPVLEARAAHIVQTWIDNAPGKLHNAYTRFFEDPRRNAYSLLAWRALAPYEHDLKEQWLANQEWYTRKVEDLTEMIDLPAVLPVFIRRGLRIQIQTYWNTRLKEHFDD